MHFNYHMVSTLPRLAWCAFIDKDSHTVHVYHGSGVETRGDGFFEGAWNGAFIKGRFDEAHTFLGSGGRVTSMGVVFCTPTHMEERLYSARLEDRLIVSNSWVFLLTQIQDRPDHTYANYLRDLMHYHQVGIVYTNKKLSTDRGRKVRLHDCCNLRVTDSLDIERIEKKICQEPDSYASYLLILQQTIGQVVQNASAPSRSQAYRPVAMLSRGYDSTAAAALGAQAGCQEAITYSKPNADDDGSIIAHYLGLDCEAFGRFDFMQRSDLPEAEFCATVPITWAPLSVAGSHLAGGLLFTGVRGGSLWSVDSLWSGPRLQYKEIRDFSNTSMKEFRLRNGFIAFPVAYIGATHSKAILNISQSPTMTPWRVPGGYDRPIPRRILEEAGVPRHLFGQQKHRSAHHPFAKMEHLSPASRQDFKRFCGDNDIASPYEGSRFSLSVSQWGGRLWNKLVRLPLALYHPLMPMIRSLLWRSRHPAWQPELLYLPHWGFDRISSRYLLPEFEGQFA